MTRDNRTTIFHQWCPDCQKNKDVKVIQDTDHGQIVQCPDCKSVWNTN